MSFPSIRIEGNIISHDILSKLDLEGYAGQSAKDFGLQERAKVKDEIAFAYATAKDYWRIFQRKVERIDKDATATTETRNEWLRPLVELLGYKPELVRTAEVVNGKSFSLSHRATTLDEFPLHLVSIRDDLDKRRQEGGPRMSPHGLLQEYLNITEHAYGLVSNGKFLRLLRDSGKLVKLSFLEFDLQRIVEDDLYSDFAILYRLLHASRMPKSKELAEESIIERYHQDSLEAGARIREALGGAVEQSIQVFANGFISHPDNQALRDAIASGELTSDRLFQSLLRLIYRLLFLMVIEERDIIYPEKPARPSGGSDDEDLNRKRELYYKYYSLDRIRRLSERRLYGADRFDDLWQALKSTFLFFEKGYYGTKLGIQPLDGDLFDVNKFHPLNEVKLRNDMLLSCFRMLNVFEDEKRNLIRVNYGSLDVEEFGSVYEGLLEHKAELLPASGVAGQPIGSSWSFVLVKGSERSSSGSHYTPEELVQPLIKHSLDYVIEEKLKSAKSTVSKFKRDDKTEQDALVLAKMDALLSIKVCDVACGSGHILLSAARRIATALAQTLTDEEQPSPTAFRSALREVIRHCIYGVDKNPLAVELCKVALWLEAHNPNMPLTFLDHRIKCGDSVVGLARIEELRLGVPDEAFKTLPGDGKEIAAKFRKNNKAQLKHFEAGQLKLYNLMTFEEALADLAGEYWRFSLLSDDTVQDFERKKAAFERLGGERWYKLHQLADMHVAQFFLRKNMYTEDYLATTEDYADQVVKMDMANSKAIRAQGVSAQKRFFHWFLEFPEVFADGRNPGASSMPGGFDCILGNPPFLGGQRLSGTFGDDFLNYLKSAYAPAGAVDLAAYFFRRVFTLLRPGGFQALLATNTIAQGDAREGGLDVIAQQGGSINYAVRSMRWPGTAAVEVAQVAIHKGEWKKARTLGNNQVPFISTYLDDAKDIGKPYILKQNEGKSFQGTIVLGSGFVLTPDQAQRLIERNPSNKDVLFPYLNGEDLNSRPDQSPSRWVINFVDWPLDRDAPGRWAGADEEEQKEWLKAGSVPEDYPGKVAADYPDCLEIVERLVKPERTRRDENGDFVLRKPLPQRWWIYGEKRPGLYRAIGPLERVLVVAQVSKTVAFAFVSTKQVLDAKLVVFAMNDFVSFASLQSSLHNAWAWKYSVTMKTDLSYSPTFAFETFPLMSVRHSPQRASLQEIGERYYTLRNALCHSLNIGLTRFYRLFHTQELDVGVVSRESKTIPQDPNDIVGQIHELRFLHRHIDELLTEVYGGMDVSLDHGFHEVEYLPENDRVRYTISEKARKEVLRRLLELNHKIHEEEVKAEKVAPKTKKRALQVKEEISIEDLRAYALMKTAELTEGAKRVYAVKILYFLQACKAINLRYRWTIKTYGPYPDDDEFETTLNSLAFNNLIESENEYSQVQEKPIKVRDTGLSTIADYEKRYGLSNVNEAIQQTIRDFDPKRYSSTDMELRATLVFLHKQNPEWKFDELVSGLKKEKGKKFGQKEVEDAIIELERLMYIGEEVG